MVHLLGWSNSWSLICNMVCWVRFLCVYKSPYCDRYIFDVPYTIVAFVMIPSYAYYISFLMQFHTLDVIQNNTYIPIQLIILQSWKKYKFTQNAQSRPILHELGLWRLTWWGFDTRHPLLLLNIVMHLVVVEAQFILITFK